MSRQPSSASALDNLKKEAKRWLKALRGGDEEARARLARAYPEAPAVPSLRAIQHALALEHGLPGWTALKHRAGGGSVTRAVPADLIRPHELASERPYGPWGSRGCGCLGGHPRGARRRCGGASPAARSGSPARPLR